MDYTFYVNATKRILDIKCSQHLLTPGLWPGPNSKHQLIINKYDYPSLITNFLLTRHTKEEKLFGRIIQSYQHIDVDKITL